MNPSVEWAISVLDKFSQMGYTGKVEINFFEGGIAGLNCTQSIKPMMEVRLIPMGREVVVR